MRYAPLFARVEAQAFNHPALRRLQAGLGADEGAPVSHRLARFSRRYALVELRRNQFHPLFNLLTLMDVHALFALERWRCAARRARCAAGSRRWRSWRRSAAFAGLAHDRPAALLFPR